MATLGSNQSERRKDNGAIVFWVTCLISIGSVINLFTSPQMGQSESRKGFACLDTRPFAVELTGLICFCVREPQTEPQSPRITEKTGCLMESRTDADTSQNYSQIPRIGRDE